MKLRLRLVLVWLLFNGISNSIYAQDSLKAKVCGDSVVAFAKTLKGTTYKYGQCSPKSGFDCSGFTHFVFAHFGIDVPRASAAYANFGKEIPKDSCKPGDIIVFTGTNHRVRKPGHVGIVISEPGTPLRFIHASSSKNHYGVVETDFENSGYVIRYIKIIRVL